MFLDYDVSSSVFCCFLCGGITPQFDLANDLVITSNILCYLNVRDQKKKEAGVFMDLKEMATTSSIG
jgi:hypothetical protein